MLEQIAEEYILKDIYGRYIHLGHIQPILLDFSAYCAIDEIGFSENNLPIHLIKLGSGKKKLLFWSQMHGNESTTTKSILDITNWLLKSNDHQAKSILDSCTLYIIPILNPDGALLYTRLNYNSVDLNRDAQDLTQKESRILKRCVDTIQPDFAFNLHGQRTIFGVGKTGRSATVSFLSPASDEKRSSTPQRKIGMKLISVMNTVLQNYIPDGVGRYDDGFNLNCVGDTLSNFGIPTLLFEAGHFPGDYEREETRKLMFYSLFEVLNHIANCDVNKDGYETYFAIPENEKNFYDIIIRDVVLNEKNVDIALQYKEVLSENVVKFIPKIVKIENLGNFYAHKEIIGNKREIRSYNDRVEVVPETELLNYYLDDELFSTELTKT